MSHSFQGLLESAIESLGDTTSSLGQAYAKLEKSRSDFPRLTKLGKCRQKYTLTTKCSYEESKNWLHLNIQPALDNIIGHLEKQAENLEEEERVLTQSVDVAIKETRREQQNKQSETSEKEQTLNELKTKRRQYSRQIEEASKVNGMVISLNLIYYNRWMPKSKPWYTKVLFGLVF